jgi:hypothetical protein
LTYVKPSTGCKSGRVRKDEIREQARHPERDANATRNETESGPTHERTADNMGLLLLAQPASRRGSLRVFIVGSVGTYSVLYYCSSSVMGKGLLQRAHDDGGEGMRHLINLIPKEWHRPTRLRVRGPRAALRARTPYSPYKVDIHGTRYTR